MKPVFRKPAADDYVAISQVHNAQNEPDHRHPPKTFRRWDDAPQSDLYAERYVGVLNGEVVATGYRCHSWWGRTYPGRYWVNLYVRHDHQNKGVDTQMLHHALRDLEPPAAEVWTVIRSDFLEPAGFVRDEGFEVQGRTWGAHLDLAAFDASRFREVQERLEAEGFRFLPYRDLTDPDKHAKVQTLHAEAKREMPLFEPVATADFDDGEDESTLLETVRVALGPDGKIVGVSSIDRNDDEMLQFGLTAVTALYRYRGIGRVLKALSADAAKRSGHIHVNSGGTGTDTPILRVNRALGFEIEPAWLTLASKR